ncbi:MAG: threonine--tRNA ligase [Armatimonadota bacterium]
MGQIEIRLPDGSVRSYESGVTPAQIAADLGPRLAGDAVAAAVNGDVVDLTRPLTGDAELRILTFDTTEGREVYRHSASHVMADAVLQLFPGTKLAIGPAIEEGFYYDFDMPGTLSPEDLGHIEARMREIIAADLPFQRQEVSREQARQLFAERDNHYKLELLEEMDEETVTLYRHGDFVDLCLGPHLPSTGKLGAVKLLSVAGAYWRGDEGRQMLQRVYGTAYPSQKQVDEHLKRLEEAQQRDHRRLGRELDLFSIADEVGPGLVLWHPKGAIIREQIEDFWREVHRERGYQLVYTPHIGKIDLWHTSGHTDWFSDEMYSPMDAEGQQYMIKPMNCPFHVLIYKSQVHSYRDLPLRLGEMGTVYRYQRSGTLHGLLRVRGFTQDDAHVFCRPDQLEEELVGVIDLAQFMMETFGYDEYRIWLSVRDPQQKEKYIGDDASWEQAEAALIHALEAKGLGFQRAEGEAKFYGPAIDILLKDAIGRLWQGPTIQVDFNEPERFDVTFVNAAGQPERVVMVHRAVLGALERFIAGLIEHVAGAFPLWLAPVQVTVLPITDRQQEYAHEVARRLEAAGLRVELDERSETLNYRIRDAQLQRVPYMLVLGDREQQAGNVALRLRSGEDKGATDLDEFIAQAQREVASRAAAPPPSAQ